MNIKHFELVKIAEEFLEENYGMELGIPIFFNTRLKSTLGRFIYDIKGNDNVPKKIELSVEFMQNHPRENIINVLKHELIHYALCYHNKPFKDGQWYFENELKKHGVHSTNYFMQTGDIHRYTCKECGQNYDRKRKLPKTSRCGCSNYYNLEYVGVIHKTYTGEVASKSK